MADQDFSIKRRRDGSIDFDAYRAEAARERKATRDRLLWDVALPFLWSAPAKVVAIALRMRLRRQSGSGAKLFRVDPPSETVP